MATTNLPGWYVDAIEQNLGVMIASQRQAGESVEQIATKLLDPHVQGSNEHLSDEQHVQTLAICVAILIRRLARIDMPT